MIIQNILTMEQEAGHALQNLPQALEHQAETAAQALKQELETLETQKHAAIDELQQKINNQTAQHIAKIQAIYKQKGVELTDAFAKNHSTWVNKLTHQVLHCDT